MRMRTWLRIAIAALAVLAVMAGVAARYFRNTHTRLTAAPAMPAPRGAARLPRPAHVVVIIDENKAFSDIIGDEDAPYLNQLAARGAVFTQSYGVAHPSQPNYFALFAGRTNDNGDACDVAGIPPDAPNLGAAVLASHRSFVGYAEGLPSTGFPGCTSGDYARKHAPWTHFSAVPGSASRPFTALGRRFDALPTVAFIIPDLQDDMHNTDVQHGDAWLRRAIDPLIEWAMKHDTLVVITWDESSSELGPNRIPTFFVGPMVKPGRYDEPISHYRVLRTLEDLYGLPHAGASDGVPPITGVWR